MAFSENEELPILNTADMDFMVGQVLNIEAHDQMGKKQQVTLRIIDPVAAKLAFGSETPLQKMAQMGWIEIGSVQEKPAEIPDRLMPIMTPDPQEAEKRAAVDDTGQERRVIAAQIKAEAGNSPFISVKKVLDIIGV